MRRKVPGIAIFALLIPLMLPAAAARGQSKGLAVRTTTNFRLRYEKNLRADEIGKLGRRLERAYGDYRDRLGASFHKKVDVYVFASAGRYRSASRSSVYDDADFHDGKIYLDVRTVLKSDTAQRNPIARVVSQAILDEIKWCPKWLAEVYGIHAGKDLLRFGPPAQLTASSFSDLTEDYARAESQRDLREARAKLAATARFLIGRYGESKTERMFQQFRSPVTVDQAFEAAFGEKMPVIEKAWAAALRTPPKG